MQAANSCDQILFLKNEQSRHSKAPAAPPHLLVLFPKALDARHGHGADLVKSNLQTFTAEKSPLSVGTQCCMQRLLH